MEGFSGNTEGSHMDNFPEHLRVNVREIFNLSGRSIFELSKIIFLMMIGMIRGVQKGTFQISMLLRY